MPGVAHHYLDSGIEGITGTVRFDWEALDAWFEEDEQVFVHPRNPYTRVTRSAPTARSGSSTTGPCWPSRRRTVMVFETGLPTRYYFDRLDVRLRTPPVQ